MKLLRNDPFLKKLRWSPDETIVGILVREMTNQRIGYILCS